MESQQNIDAELKELKQKVKDKKVIVGVEMVLKLLKKKSLEKIYLAANSPAKLRQDVEHYAKLSNTPVIQLSQTNEELGIFCKKNFFVSVLGVCEGEQK